MTRILLVEDNQLNREMFARRLERKGFQVVTAGNGQEAVNLARSERLDLILMDRSLPIRDGGEATRRLKKDEGTRALPIIALTAHAMVGDREKALAAGCEEYETKPVDLPRLMAKIEKLAGPRSAAQNKQPPQAPSLLTRPTPSAAETARPAAPPSADAPLILVVDDNQLNRDLLSRRLEREGFRVALANDGREAVARVEQQHFDLVLLDVMMPQLNGIEVLQHIRRSFSMLELPVLILTAKSQSEDVVSALRMGANDYVTK